MKFFENMRAAIHKWTAKENRIVKPDGMNERTYRELVSLGGANSDWALTLVGEDSELWQNAWALTSRVRDLFRCNPLYQSYRECLWSNVLGARGPQYRPEIKETEDRVVQDAAEKHAISEYELNVNEVGEFYASKRGIEWVHKTYLHVTGHNGSSRAQVKIGQPDVYAMMMISKAWKEWQRREYCDTRGMRNYQTMRQLRLIGAVRDGDFFIRIIQNPRVNKFGFSLQLINAEWCDRFYNTILPNGNTVIMGIEYQFDAWGIGKPVRYYFIKRQPQDWQFSIPGMFNFASGELHDVIDADEIIHYSRAVDAEQTRPAPWVASCIPSSRQVDQAMLAEVIAWRESACQTGFYYSDIIPEGGIDSAALPDPRKVRMQDMAPGESRGLPYGVKWQERSPQHPNANVKEFRMAALQNITAGMPGANYSTMANDYAAINYSAGQLQRLDSNENFMVLQAFDCDYGERPIFEAWLKMALITGAVPLPVARFDKYNSQTFAYRSWKGVDEVKSATASALRVANHQSDDYTEAENNGMSFDEIMERQARANMVKEMYGIPVGKTVQSGAPMVADAEDEEEGETDDPEENDTSKPKPKPKVTKKQRLSLT